MAQPVRFFFASGRPGAIRFTGSPSASFGNRSDAGLNADNRVFAEWDWDGEKLIARNDRLGFCPLYVYQKGDSVGVSPSITRLIDQGADRSLDYPAIALAIRLGQFVGDDSPFRYIRALTPNSRLTWDGASLCLTGGISLQSSAAKINRTEAERVYIEMFRGAIRRRRPSPGKFAVPLSGGRDSRHILFELVHNGFRPDLCVTYKTTPEDVRVAGLICQRLGIRHVVVEESDQPYLDEVKKNILTSFGTDEGAYPLAICRALINHDVRTVYDGIGGDVLSAGLFLTNGLLQRFRNTDPREVAESMLPQDAELAIEKVLSPEIQALCTRSSAVERLGQEISKYSQAHNPVTSFYFWNRTRRKIGLVPYAMFDGIENVVSPYLDHSVFEFLTTLPADIIVDHTFHTAVIRNAYPELATIPYENKEAPEFDRLREHKRFAAGAARATFFVKSPSLLKPLAFKTRLALGVISPDFGASQHWFLRRAAWCFQLGRLVEGNG